QRAVGLRGPHAQVASALGPHEAREDGEGVRWNRVSGGDLVRDEPRHLHGEDHQVRPAERRPAFPEAGAASAIVIRGGQGALRLEAEATYPQVVLEVSPHAREVDDGLDAETLEVGMWSNARQQEEARRVDRPGAKDHLPGHTDGTQFAVQQEIEAGTA